MSAFWKLSPSEGAVHDALLLWAWANGWFVYEARDARGRALRLWRKTHGPFKSRRAATIFAKGTLARAEQENKQP